MTITATEFTITGNNIGKVVKYKKTVVIKPLLIYATVYVCGIFSTSTMAIGEFCTKTKDTYSCHTYCEQQGFQISPQTVIAAHLINIASSLPIRVPKSEGKIGLHSCEVQNGRTDHIHFLEAKSVHVSL